MCCCLQSFQQQSSMAQVGNLILVGTYEHFMLGFKVVAEERNEKKLSLVRTIACHSHKGCIRSLAVGGVHVASGGSDDCVQLYNIINQVQGINLSHHTGTVTALAFTENGSHLITGSEDGMITVVNTSSWIVEKKWAKCHSGRAVTGLSVHPSSKLALSIGSDNHLVTWDLVKGRNGYVTNLSSRCRRGQGVGDVQWSPSGSSYAVYMTSHVEIYSVEIAGISHIIVCSNKVTAIAFLEDDVILVGEESGEASIHKLRPPSKRGKEGKRDEILRFQAHDRRVKCASSFGLVKDGAHNASHFVTAGGSGQICLWELQDCKVKKLCEADTDCRITCMVLVDLAKELNIKKETVKEETISKDIDGNTPNGIAANGSSTSKEVKKRKLSNGDSNSLPGANRGTSTSISSKKEKPEKLHSEPQLIIPKEKTKKRRSSNGGQWVVTPIK